MKTVICSILLFFALSSGPVSAESELPRIEPWARQYAAAWAPEVMARAALLLDAETGTVLFEKGADIVIPPASLTKVMAMHVVFAMAARGEVDLDESVAVAPESWAVNMPPGSSLMFLGPEQEVSLRELLLGLAVPSGNDAAVAVAQHTAGSVEAFAELMTREARALGLPTVEFQEPSGLSSDNRVTAREFAQFLRHYVQLWPHATRDYHSQERFSWPPDAVQPITQYNRNSMLQSYPGVDGVKTGFIRQSRYNLALSAQRDGRRLIAVLLGVPGENHIEGERNRARDATRLLDYGFEHFHNVELQLPLPEAVRVWKGTRRTVELSLNSIQPEPRLLTVALRDRDRLEGELVQQHEVEAPVALGQELGRIRISAAENELLEIPLRAAEEVARGNLLRVIWDSVLRFVLQLLVSLRLSAP